MYPNRVIPRGKAVPKILEVVTSVSKSMAETPLPTSTVAAPIEIDLSGRRLGDYQILRRLGRGAMAEVYLAEQITLGRQVALKILKRELAADDNYIKRFQNEARAAAALVHANIVQIYEVGCLEGHYYIAQEYVPGQNLRDLLARRGTPDIPKALSILRQTAAALTKAADQGIVHRDIKPENILVTREGEVKVADFGLARIITKDQAASLNLTQIGVTMGTPLYMSPEQVEGRPLDSRSDLYSLGVTMFHLLSGQPPFRGDNALSVAVQHLQTAPERLENLRPDLPAGMCRVVHKLLAKDPAERYPTPRDLLLELRALYRELATENWSEEWNEWSSGELTSLSDARLAATQELAGLMMTQALMTRKARPGWRLLWGALAACGLGAVIAWGARGDYLLKPGEGSTGIERQKTAKDQYEYARMYLGGRNLEAWQSVLEYFPQDKVNGNLAKRQLAWLRLDAKQYEQALKFFSDLAAEEEAYFRLYGQAGEALVYYSQKQMDKFYPVWKRLEERRLELESKNETLVKIIGGTMNDQLDIIRRDLPPAPE